MKAALKYWRKGLGSGRSENRNAACVSKTQAAFRKKAGRQESASECAQTDLKSLQNILRENNSMGTVLKYQCQGPQVSRAEKANAACVSKKGRKVGKCV
jgi:hypothetical protein